MLIMPSPARQQVPPPGSRINWGHPLASSGGQGVNEADTLLIGAWLFNGKGLIVPNLASPGDPAALGVVSNAKYRGARSRGLGLEGDGSTATNCQYAIPGSAGTHLYANTQITVSVLFQSDTPSTTNQIIMARHATNSRNGFGIRTNGGNADAFIIDNGGTSFVATGTAIPGDQEHMVSYTTGQNVTALLYQNGKQTASVNVTSGWGWGSQNIRWAQSEDSFWGKFDGLVLAAWWHVGWLTPAMVREFHAEPFAMFESPAPFRNYFVFPAAGGLVGDANRTQAVVVG